MVNPLFRRGPEAFNSIEMVSASRFPLVFSDDHMVTADIKKRAGVSIIGAGEAVCLCVVYHARAPNSRFPLLAIGNVSTVALL